MMKILLAGLAAALVLPGSAIAEDTIKLGVANIDTGPGPYAVSGPLSTTARTSRLKVSTRKAARSGANTSW